MTYSLKKLPFLTVASAIFSICMAIPSQAAIISYTMSGTATSGPLVNQTYSGSFSFDDASLTGSGEEFLPVSSILFNFDGTTFTEADATTTPQVAFSDGTFRGLSFEATRPTPAPSLLVSLVPGNSNPTDAFFTYQQGAFSGDGNITYTASVPESSSVVGLLAIGVYGLGILSNFAKTRISR